ncbi:hypothetical protein DV738_g3201, partial [Chaetothyriales sp. CBS 135597]
MKPALIIAALAAPLALAGPLKVRDTAEETAKESSTVPALIEWGGHVVKGLWGKAGLRRSASAHGPGGAFGFGYPPGYGPGPGPQWSVTVTVVTQTVTVVPSPTTPELTSAEPVTTEPTSTQTSIEEPEPTTSTEQPEPTTTTEQPEPTTSDSASSAPATASVAASWDWAEDETWLGDQPSSFSYAKPILDAHNIHRANHSVVNLQWNHTMEQTAKQISETCVYAHSSKAGDGIFGQNIGAGFAADNIAAMVGDAMYNDEIELYPGPYGNEPDMTSFESWGHYTQIVWSDTTDVGCWTTDCSATGLANVAPEVGPQFTVCNYYPPGNIVGDFAAKVNRPGTLANVVITSSD